MIRLFEESADLLLVALLTILFAALLLLFPDWQGASRVALGSIFLLLLPGYAIVTALFPRRQDIDISERVMLSLAVSVLAIVFMALALNYSEWGISLPAMTWGLASLTVLLSVLGLYRRWRVAVLERFVLTDFVRSRTLLWGLSIFILVVLLVQTVMPRQRFTEFYVMNHEGRLLNFPQRLTPGEAFSLRIGVGNFEGRQQEYVLRLPHVTESLSVPSLADEQSWETDITLYAPEELGSSYLYFGLYRPYDLEQPYRSLRLSIDVVPDL